MISLLRSPGGGRTRSGLEHAESSELKVVKYSVILDLAIEISESWRWNGWRTIKSSVEERCKNIFATNKRKG